MIKPFHMNSLGELVCGCDSFTSLHTRLVAMGLQRVAVVVSNTFSRTEQFIAFVDAAAVRLQIYRVSGEPTVDAVDRLVRQMLDDQCDAVMGIGGGSALDTAKATAVMVNYGQRTKETVSVERFLEGVGDLSAPRGRLPLIMVPTTAGTGSEATTNAVISRVGADGFKKSLRHDSYLPDLIIIDPALTVAVNHQVTAAAGLDALTQLMEAYVSTQANIHIDTLALTAIGLIGQALPRLLSGELSDLSLRSDMAYAAYISGMAIAHTGLGYVHGLAGPLGALHEVPHGVICGALIAPVHAAMITQGTDQGFTEKCLRIGEQWGVSTIDEMVDHLYAMVQLAQFPPLRTFGFTHEELQQIGSTNAKRNSPVTLEAQTVIDLLIQLL